MLKLLQAKFTYVRIEVIVITIEEKEKKKTWKSKTFTEISRQLLLEIYFSLTNQLKSTTISKRCIFDSYIEQT